MEKQNLIIDDNYTSILNDIEKIQAKPTMYISYTGDRAFTHLSHEIVNNVLDEYKNKNDISNGEFNILYDEMENMLFVEDNGRGIPFEEVENACTILQSGTKMHREHGNSAGENGTGMTATNALSEIFEITTYRNGEMRMLQFKNGKKTLDKISKVKDKNKHGLLVGFTPSKLYLGKSKLDTDDLDLWLTKLIFSQNSRIKIKFTIRPAGKEQPVLKVYQNTTGIGGFLDKLEPDSNYLKTPIVLSGKTVIMERDIPFKSDDGEINLIDMERDLELNVVINFKEDSQDTIKYSFCNDIENIEHGEHLNGALNALITFLRKRVKDDMKKGDEIDVTNNDILFGLTIMVNMNTDYSTGLFTGQTKHKMDNRTFYEPIRKLTTVALENYFKLPENKKTLTKVISFIKDNVRARLASTKARKSSRKQKTFLESAIIAGYYPPNDIEGSNSHEQGCELYIVEGDSAGANARTGRVNPDIQGVVGLGGKPSNGYKLPDDCDVAKKAPDIAQFFNDILGCGMGKNFRLEDCRYKRIIIASDSDIDGDHICGLVVANIYRYARPLLEHGMVYRVITPLYALRAQRETKKLDPNLYLYNKEEFFSVYEKRASDVYKIKISLNDDKFVNKDAMRRFLQTNRDYYKAIDVLAKQNTTHPDIIEYLAIHLNDYQTTLHNDFKELTYDKKNHVIKGVYDGQFHSFIIDNDIIKVLKYLHEVIYIGNEGLHHYHLFKVQKTKDEPIYLGYQSIFSIMNYCQGQEPEIESRFKGQGELSAAEFSVLAMNPNHRSLIRISIYDAESVAQTIDDLFSDSKAEARKQMIANADISIEDIDN